MTALPAASKPIYDSDLTEVLAYFYPVYLRSQSLNIGNIGKEKFLARSWKVRRCPEPLPTIDGHRPAT